MRPVARPAVRAAAGVLGVVAAVAGLGAAFDGRPEPVRRAAVFTTPGGADVLLDVPAGYRVLTSGHRVALMSRDGDLRLVVSTPDAVVAPGSGPDDGPVPLPADPVRWLSGHPDLDVVAIGGLRAVPLVVRAGVPRAVTVRSAEFAVTRAGDPARQLGRFATVRLFCDDGDASCGRVSTQVVVRAAFVDTGGPGPVLVTAYWPRGSAGDPDGAEAAMPAGLAAAYRRTVEEVVRQAPADGAAAASGRAAPILRR